MTLEPHVGDQNGKTTVKRSRNQIYKAALRPYIVPMS